MRRQPADKSNVVRLMKRRAMRDVFRGRNTRNDQLYLRSCMRVVDGATLILSRDVGHYTCGWFKNPDYERCWHLSTAPVPSSIWTPATRELDRKERDGWLFAFFGPHLRMVWAEPPMSAEGKSRGVWHWRLFCDPEWQPILPRGEVYSSELTEAGWRSASEVLAG